MIFDGISEEWARWFREVISLGVATSKADDDDCVVQME